MRAPNRLYLLTASQALDLLKNNTITVEEYARSLLSRIKERDGIVKAWAYLGGSAPMFCKPTITGPIPLIGGRYVLA